MHGRQLKEKEKTQDKGQIEKGDAESQRQNDREEEKTETENTVSGKGGSHWGKSGGELDKKQARKHGRNGYNGRQPGGGEVQPLGTSCEQHCPTTPASLG